MQQLLKISEELENLVKKNDLVGDLLGVCKIYDIQSTDNLKKILVDKNNNDRDLKLGILGRVKAGKSSFLNALIFNGKNILPKAATPMTAALTILEFGEKFEAKVDFFSREELNDIKSKHKYCQDSLNEYEELQFNKFKENNRANKSEEELRVNAKKYAIQQLKSDSSIYAAYEQYEQIQASGVDIDNIQDSEIISCDNYDELSKKLLNYVGSDGKYTPFTKSITLRLNEDKLKDLKIIDTPGINDPIISREERTRMLVAECDAVFLVSPSGQFLAQQDLNLLNTVNEKNGIKSFYIIASQFDNTLSSPEIKKDGVLPDAISRAKIGLNRQQQSVFLSKRNEYGDTICDNFLKNEVIFSSGVSIEIINNFDDLQDSNSKVVLNNLNKNYPDYFIDKKSTIKNLAILSNIDCIVETIKEIRILKDKIIKARLNDFITSKKKALHDYAGNIEKIISDRIKFLETWNINEIKQSLSELNIIKNTIEITANNSFKNLGILLCKELIEKLTAQVAIFFNDIAEEKENAKGSETVTKIKTIDHGRGFLFWRSIVGKRFEKKKYTTTENSVDASRIRTALQESTEEIGGLLSMVYDNEIKQWIKKFFREITKELKNNVSDIKLDLDLIENSIMSVLTNISFPKFKYNSQLPDALRKSGKLIGYECEEFMCETENYAIKLKNKSDSDIKTIEKIINETIHQSEIGNKIINKYIEQIDNLTKDLSDKENSIKKYKNILSKLKEISCS